MSLSLESMSSVVGSQSVINAPVMVFNKKNSLPDALNVDYVDREVGVSSDTAPKV